jgi:small conductance mechanosensitive channel
MGVGWLLIRLIQSGVVLSWQLGLDPRRRLAPARSAANVIIIIAVVMLLVRRALEAAPIASLLALVIMTGAMTLVLSQPIQDIGAGFVIAFRRRIRAGDRITVAGQVGIVKDISLTQIHLQSPDGASIFIPNRIVLHEALKVEQAKNTQSATVQMIPDRPAGSDTLEAVRQAALFSPFRVPGTALDVSVMDNGAVQVTIQAWSGSHLREARIDLDSRLQALLQPRASNAPAASSSRTKA